MNWHMNMNQKSYIHGASGEVAAKGVFVPSLGLKAQNEITLTAVNTTKTG